MGTERVQHEQKSTQLKFSGIRGPHRFDISHRTKNSISVPKSIRVLAAFARLIKNLAYKINITGSVILCPMQLPKQNTAAT